MLARSRCPLFDHRALWTRVEVPIVVYSVSEVILMKRRIFQMTLGMAAMLVVLVGMETQANAFGSHGGSRGSCGSHGGLFRGGSNGSSGCRGGLFHRNHGSCGGSSCESSCG